MIEILLAQPRGFCAGVDRAIEIVERALERHGAPIYVRHEIVHNTHVVAQLRAKGAIFVEELDEVPTGATLVFSAHGVSRAVREAARKRGLNVFDATCPLVTKVHVEVAKMRAQGREIVMIGHAGHPEVEGTMGQADSGIYLRATPQVQIWDYTKEGGRWNIGADKGSGGLWNNDKGSPGKDPLVLADKPFGEWNHFRKFTVSRESD